MENERFLIYSMRGKLVHANIPKRFGDFILTGVIDKIYRDVLEKNIIIEIKNKVYVFREPNIISKLSDTEIVFAYGDASLSNISDDLLFEELKEISVHGGSIEDVLNKFNDDVVTIIVFELKEIKNERKRRSKVGRHKKRKSTNRKKRSVKTKKSGRSKKAPKRKTKQRVSGNAYRTNKKSRSKNRSK
jgi:hypothetical protein